MDSLTTMCQTQSVSAVNKICKDRRFTTDELIDIVTAASRLDDLDMFDQLCNDYQSQIYYNCYALWCSAFNDSNLVMLEYLKYMIDDYLVVTMPLNHDAPKISVDWYIDNMVTDTNINNSCIKLLPYPLSSNQLQYLLNHPSADFSKMYFHYHDYSVDTLAAIMSHPNYRRPDAFHILDILKTVARNSKTDIMDHLVTTFDIVVSRDDAIKMLMQAVSNTPEMCDYIVHKYGLTNLTIADLTTPIIKFIGM